jgi:hypothetical protein
MENEQTLYFKRTIKVILSVWILSIISFLIVFLNILAPFLPAKLSPFVSNLLTNQNFSFFSSLFLLTSLSSLILSQIMRKEIKFRKIPRIKIIKSIILTSVIEIFLFIILLIIYFIL